MSKKTITVICPKEHNKKYFSFKENDYSNYLNIYFNNNLIFEGINDAEENLPIELKSNIDIQYDIKNVLKFKYNITFDNSIKELIDFVFTIIPINDIKHNIQAEIYRHNFVKNSEFLSDEYKVTLNINEHEFILDKNYHHGENKLIIFNCNIDLINQGLNIFLSSKKVFNNDKKNVTYDQIELKIC
jgi:hypothetical protein